MVGNIQWKNYKKNVNKKKCEKNFEKIIKLLANFFLVKISIKLIDRTNFLLSQHLDFEEQLFHIFESKIRKLVFSKGDFFTFRAMCNSSVVKNDKI